MTGQSAAFASLGVMVVTTALLGANASTLAQDAVPQNVRQQCCVETGGSWQVLSDGSKDAQGTPRGVCATSSRSTNQDVFVACLTSKTSQAKPQR